MYVGVMTESKRLAPLDEAAKRAGVTVRTIQRWRDAGYLSTYRHGINARRVSVDLNEVDLMIERINRPVAS